LSEVYEGLNRGLALHHGGHPYEAHEVWEDAWRKEPSGARREVLKALIQIAAAEVKRSEPNDIGVKLALEKAIATLDRAASESPSVLGIDLVALRGEVLRALEVSRPPALPRSSSEKGLLYLHGFASGPSSEKARRFIAATKPLEVPDLNEDDFEHLTISRAKALARRKLKDRTIVIGSSFGGYTASLLAAEDRRVVALVLMAPAFDMARRLSERYGERALAEWESEGTVLVDHYVTGAKARIGFGLIEDARTHPAIPKIVTPTYILHGLRDDTVPYLLSERARGSAPELVELDLVDDEHGLVDSTGRAIAALERFVKAMLT
jgi:uncharacterized protein